MGLEERASILPAGTVTFLLAEVERLPLGQTAPGGGDKALARLDEVITSAVADHGGVQPVMQGGGGRGVAAFPSASEAVAAALAIQRAVATETGAEAATETWPGGRAPVRIGLHTGETHIRDDRDYAGAALDRCARLRDVAHGGQTLLSSATASVVADALPPRAQLNDLGTHRLRDLSRPERVYELRHPDLPGDLPPLRSLDALANNLPVQLTSFVGRGEELAAVELLLDGERLVTLTGTGGAGKTRLALHAAAEMADRWPDGVWWVDLGPVTDQAGVAELVASATGVLVEPVGGPLRALTVQLRDRRLLVCLDNCEHLIETSAELLRSCPGVSILATSREPLDLPGETVWRVPSLVEDEAVSLFVDRASHVRPWFSVDETNEAAVRRLCRRLDGMPLAIELAAAWLRTLTPAQIASGLDDRFALLVRGPRGAVARQQTLAASIDWSHDLLDTTDQVVFRRLAVFSGGFSLDAARTVCAADPIGPTDVLASLARLVDKSLVVMEERDGEARYRLLETIRQYATDRLEDAGEGAATRDRHLAHFVALAETAEPGLVDTDQDTWLARFEIEHDNLRAALDWGLSLPDPDPARRLAAVLFWLWYLHGHTKEGVDYLQRAIERAPDEASPLQALLYTGVAAVSIASGRFDVLVDHALRGLELATAVGDDRTRGKCLLLLGVAQSFLDFDGAAGVFEQAAAAAEASDDRFVADRVVVMRGLLLAYGDRHEEARPILEEGFERCLRRGDRGFAAMALDYQVVASVLRGDLPRAEELATRAFEIARPRGDFYDVGLSTGHLAFVKAFAGDLDAAERLLEPLLRSVEGVTYVYVPRLTQAMGRLSLLKGDFEAARAWYQRDIYDSGPMAEGLISARSLPGLATALRRLGRAKEAHACADRALAVARKLGAPNLVADSLEEQAHQAEGAGDLALAEDLHHQALAVRLEHGIRTFMIDSLEALAGLSYRASKASHDSKTDPGPEPVRLLAAVDTARRECGYARPAITEPDHEDTLAGLRAALGDEAFDGAWSAGAALSLEEAVAFVRRARGARGRPSTGWASLTPTELDVVRCVVEGLNNPEIGARLFMSRGTVKTHLSHVYAKLGIANRTELATMAARNLGQA
jgi:predicted ATPase/class 3 adenylate cyclase/DNA-binding CsgD family transcriptional regulator